MFPLQMFYFQYISIWSVTLILIIGQKSCKFNLNVKTAMRSHRDRKTQNVIPLELDETSFKFPHRVD